MTSWVSLSRTCLRSAKTAERIDVLSALKTLGGSLKIVLNAGFDPRKEMESLGTGM